MTISGSTTTATARWRCSAERGADEDERPAEQLRRISDEEALPEPPERTERPDERGHLEPTASAAAACREGPILRMTSESTAAVAANTPTSTRIMRSLPGQWSPDPSPTQKTPKLVNMMPTASFIVFSGTSESWRATKYPTTPTIAAAAAAEAAASAR